ncbi:MAG: C45 family peptidase [Spirochaetota bacterium]|nr:C45 family peptidase [Spirochaetota bacterium]
MKKKIIIGALLTVTILLSVFYYANQDKLNLLFARYQSVPYFPYKVGRYGKSYLTYHKGIPVLHLYGSPKERGNAMGRLVREQVKVLVSHFLHKMLPPKKWPVAHSKAKQLEKNIPAEYIEEMKGLSESSGIAYKDILLANTFLEMQSTIYCSVFTAHKEKSASGKLILGRNLDFESFNVAHLYDLIVVHHLSKDHSVVSIGWPGLIGVISGMNSRGLSATMLVSLTGGWESVTDKVPSTIAYRMLLDREHSVKGAYRFFRNRTIASSNNLAVADSHNESAVFELSPVRKTRIRRPTNNFLYCTNYFLVEEGKSQRDKRYSYLQGKASTYSKHREKVNLPRLKSILRKVALGRNNLQAMILQPEDRKIYLSMDKIPAASGTYLELDLNLFFNPELKQ